LEERAVPCPAAVASLGRVGGGGSASITGSGGPLEIPGTFMAEKFSVSFQRNLSIRLWISGVSVGGG
jgi:hypothetical protein